MKKCPFCAEEIHDDAIKCRFCGTMLRQGSEKSGDACRFCQAPVSSWTRMCGNCGGILRAGTVRPFARLVIAFGVSAALLFGAALLIQETLGKGRAVAEPGSGNTQKLNPSSAAPKLDDPDGGAPSPAARPADEVIAPGNPAPPPPPESAPPPRPSGPAKSAS